MIAAFQELFQIARRDEKLKTYIGDYLYNHEKYLMSSYFERYFVDELEPDFWSFAKQALLAEKKKWA